MLTNFIQRILTHSLSLFILLLGIQGSTCVVAEELLFSEIEVARIYRNPEERRESGLGTQLTEWLKFSGLLEIETEFQHHHLKNPDEQTRDRTSTFEIPTTALQLGFELGFTDRLSAEIILEVEYDGKRVLADLDEGFIATETEQWGIKVGRQYINFGEYYSHFISGPLLEFSETRGTAVIIDYSPIDAIEFTAAIFASEVGSRNGNPDMDWSISVDYAVEDESIRLGISYLSDLAESQEQLLEGDDFIQRVSAWNAYALFGFNQFEVTAEIVSATSAFAELDRNSNKPFAYNLELAYFPNPTLQIAFRLERSDELTDQPKWQYGIVTTWRPIDRFSISLEYLYGSFENNFAYDDNDNELNDRHLAAIQLSFEF